MSILSLNIDIYNTIGIKLEPTCRTGELRAEDYEDIIW